MRKIWSRQPPMGVSQMCWIAPEPSMSASTNVAFGATVTGGELSIAYQCVGDGPLDFLFIPGFVSNVELMWDIPKWADLFTRLSELGRFVFFDKRGTGCSDRTLGTGSAEDRMDDARAVADAAGIEQAVVIGLSEGAPLAILF